MPPNPPSKGSQLRGMYIQNPKNFKVGPPPLRNPAYAPGKVPNFSPPIQCHISDRRGRLCSSGVVPTGHLGTLCHNSFRNRAATLFNCLPKHIRNIVNCANPIMFKRALDNHLCSIEDSPMAMVPN